MTAARSVRGVPDLATALLGTSVAVLSGVFGLVGHGVALGHGAFSLSLSSAAHCLLAVIVVGGLTTVCARRSSEVTATALGLLGGQFAIHLMLVAGSGGMVGGHPAGHVQHGLGMIGFDPVVAAPHMHVLWSAHMLAAHLVASLAALIVLLPVVHALSWLSAHLTRACALRGGVWIFAVLGATRRRDLPSPIDSLLSIGGTRAPPAVA